MKSVKSISYLVALMASASFSSIAASSEAVDDNIQSTANAIVLPVSEALPSSASTIQEQINQRKDISEGGRADYLWLNDAQKKELSEVLKSITDATPQDKVKRFDSLLKEMEYKKASGNLAEEIKLFKRDNPINEEMERRLGIIQGHANYLWLTDDQKVELFKELKSVTNVTIQDKISKFDALLKKMSSN